MIMRSLIGWTLSWAARVPPWRVAIGACVTLVTIVGLAGILFLLAARNFLPSVSAGGVAGSSLSGWRLTESAQPLGTVHPGFDLAGQVGLSPLMLVLSAALHSSLLVLLSTALAIGIGVPVGFWLAIHAPRPLVLAIAGTANVGVAFPAFFVAFLLQVAAVELAGRFGRTVLPVYGFGVDAHLVIPVVALALAPTAYVLRLVALGARELNARDFTRTARAKGIREPAVVYRHIAPNMFGVIGEAALGALRTVLGGLVIVEYLLVWPGLGVLALRAVNVQDLPIFLLSVSLVAVFFYLTDLGLDLVTERRGLVGG